MSDIIYALEQSLAKNRYTNYTHPSYALEKELILGIQKGDLTSSLGILDQINILERAKLSKQPLNSLKYSLVASCTLFTRAIISAGVDFETAFILSDYFINLIDECKTSQEVSKLEYTMLEGFIQLVQKQQACKYNPIVYKAIAYIQHHVESKLKLEEIAAHIGVHPNYLSGVFKKEVGMTVLEYINEEKTKAIKRYLEYTEIGIGELSEIFGFGNVSYFCAFCKKHLGVSAREFRGRK